MEVKQKQSNTDSDKQAKVDRVDLVYYTDPLCCWSYAMDAHIQKLLGEYEGKISLRYCLAGMIPDWKHYNDEVNAVTKPIQMGPLWMEARHLTGVSMHDRIWIDDPPASSYPACIAIKCASLQSEEAGKLYLRLLWAALMKDGKNTSRNAVLYEVAERIPKPFDTARFKEDLMSGAGKNLFQKDLEEVRVKQITRFPTISLKAGKNGMTITGYKPFEYLDDIISKVL